MSDDKETNKDIANFHHLCKDLYKYIQRRIIKKYIYPDMEYAKITSKNSVNNILEGKKEKEWKYYKEGNISEEEKILDIFKDNDFLSKIQKCYESLDVLITALDENQKNVEFLKKKIDLGEKKIEMLSKLNTQLNQFFQKNNENKGKVQNTKIDLNDNKNVMERLNLVKSLNILNELHLMNSINDSNKKDNININNSNSTNNTNTTITNNNNIIVDNKIINNNIRTQETKEKIDLISNVDEIQNNFSNNYDKNNNNNNFSVNSFKFLNKKSKREKDDNNQDNVQIYNNEYNNHHEYNLGKNSFQQNNINKKNNKNKNKNKKNNKNQKFIQLSSVEINNGDNNNIQSNNMIQNQMSPTPNNNNNKIELKENENEIKKEVPENKEEENKSNNENKENNLEIEFDKVLKKEFSSIYSFPYNDNSKKEIIREVKIILKKIPNMKFNKQNKFDDPCLTGSFSRFNLVYLLDYFPAIDILFKCKCIEGIDELKNIATETMQKKLCIKYIQISDNYDKKNEIVKLSNKCKIKLKNGEFFIYINLFFVGVNLSNYNKKEQSINRFFFNNNMSENKRKVLICLFFRRWRRKFKLYFIMPEIFDVIINFYFNEKESLSLIIEKIFYDLFNGQLNFDVTKSNNIHNDEENIKEIKEFVSEWFSNEEDKNILSNAIISTQELIMKNDFYSTFNNE